MNTVQSAPTGDIRRSIVNVLEYTYGPVLLVLGFCGFFAGTDAAHEVVVGFLADVQDKYSVDPDLPTLNPYYMTVAFLIALPIVTHLCAVVITVLCGIYREVAARWMLNLIPVVCLASYFVGFRAAIDSEEGMRLALQTPTLFWLILGVTVFYILLVICIETAIEILEETATGGRSAFIRFVDHAITLIEAYTPVKNLRGQAGLAALLGLAIFVLYLCIVAYYGFWEPSAARTAGPIAVTAGCIILLSIVLSALTIISHHMPGNFPLILLVVGFTMAATSPTASVVLLIATLVGVWLSHRIGESRRVRGIVIFSLAALMALFYVIGSWRITECQTLAGCNILHSHAQIDTNLKDVNDFTDRLPDRGEAPIRIVAAQGGGLYAAYHTAYDLAFRADTDPNFANSLLAISGVSGGSVGAGVYWAVHNSGLCQKPDATETCYQDAVTAILAEDYLTPSLVTMLFRDLLDSIVPISSLYHIAGAGPIDRGNVLEQEIRAKTNAWLAENGFEDPDPLALPISQSAFLAPGFEPAADDAPITLPLLLLNGTRVDDGTKVLVSPIAHMRKKEREDETDHGGVPTNLITHDGQELSVVAGMVISARFPVVTPPARVRIERNGAPQTIQLVDGGYFDNSGIETAVDLVLDLREAGVDDPIELIIFKADEKEGDIDMRGTLGAPIAAFAGAWRARRDQSEVRVDDLINVTEGSNDLSYTIATTKPDLINFTLSWYLSCATFDFVRKQVKGELQGDEPPKCD